MRKKCAAAGCCCVVAHALQSLSELKQFLYPVRLDRFANRFVEKKLFGFSA